MTKQALFYSSPLSFPELIVLIGWMFGLKIGHNNKNALKLYTLIINQLSCLTCFVVIKLQITPNRILVFICYSEILYCQWIMHCAPMQMRVRVSLGGYVLQVDKVSIPPM